MTVIFLDFNGVLDTNVNMDVIDLGNLERLKRLVDMYDAKVVISSSLKNTYYYNNGRHSRFFQGILDTLLEYGIDVIGITPKGNSREEEILEYLNKHPEIDNYCILDDDYDMKKLKGNLVKLPSQIEVDQMGFTEEYFLEAVRILGSK